MNPDLHREITARITSDSKVQKSPDGLWLRKIECPTCNKREAFTHTEHPWVIRCARGNKCGAEHHVKELFSDLFDDWGTRHKATPENPNAAADAYLTSARGFSLEKLAGIPYVQESYFSHELKEGSATVRFPLAGGSWWERIIDRPYRFGGRKATFNGKYGGTWWSAPNVVKPGIKRLWLVEGIFDAIALLHHDVPAVSLMSCSNYPNLSLKALVEQLGEGERPELVIALDGDKAGAKATRQFVERARKEGWQAVAAQIPQEGRAKRDWNDLHQLDRINDNTLAECLYHGALLMAASAGEKAMLIYHHEERRSFYFRFDNCLWWWKVDLDKYNRVAEEIEKRDPQPSKEEVRAEAIKAAATLNRIGNFWPQILYYQAQPLNDEAWYYMRIDFPHDGPAMKNTFTASQLSASAEFKKRVLHMAPGAMFSGTSAQLDAIIEQQSYNIRVVQTVDFVGYSKEHGAWIFNDIAVKGGKRFALNDEDFFDLGKLSIKTLSQSVGLALNADDKAFTDTWLPLLWKAFGAKGIVALAFWFGSLFAEQIRATQASFPFLEVVGEPGAGKTTLIEFLWKLCGRRDYEGFDPSKSTLAARARNFAQVANLPVVLIEGDRDDDAKKGAFEWDELKTAYNGRSTRSRGMKNGGNETYEPPFRGAIVIAQNADVNASEAVLSRIVHLHFDRATQNPDTRNAAIAIERTELETVSGFMLRAVQKEAEVLACLAEATPKYDKALAERGELKNQRVVKNHAQMMALVDALRLVLPISQEQRNDTIGLLKKMAVERQEALASDHPIVAAFWELYDFLEGSGQTVNHSIDTALIAINLNHFEQACADRHVKPPLIADLKRHLKTSRTHKFKANKAVNSAVNAAWNAQKPIHLPDRPSTVKCWVFEA